MKNIDLWKPSKFVLRGRRYRATRNTDMLSISSRLVADLVVKAYEKYIPKYASGVLLDLGCGKVPLYQIYRDYVSETICIDWANTPNSNPHLDYECDISKNLPISDNSIDTIILSDVLEHIPEPESLWNEMARVLKTKGVLIINVPFYYKLHEDPYDYYRYTRFALERFSDKFEFKIEILESIGGSLEIFADLLAKHVRYLPILGNSVARFIQYLVYSFNSTHFGASLSRKSGMDFPLGYFLVAKRI